MMKSGMIALVAACMLVLLLVLPAAAVTTTVPKGGTVFIGEEGLDLSGTLVGGDSQIAYYAPGADVGTSAPEALRSVSSGATFYVSPSDFLGRTGAWYSYPNGVNGTAEIAVFVEEPYLNVRLWVYPSNAAPRTAEGYKLITGDKLNFRIETNTYPIFSRPGVTAADDGIDIYVTEPDGTTYTALFDSVSGATSIATVNLKPTSSVWYIPNPSSKQYIWDTGNPAYKSGTYEYRAEISVNDMKENYGGGDGNAVQETVTSDILGSATEPLTPTATPTPDYIEATGTVDLNVDTGGYVQVDTRLWDGSSEGAMEAYVFLPKGTQALNEKAQALRELSLYVAAFLHTGVWPDVPEGQNELVAYYLGPGTGPDGRATFSPAVELGILISDNAAVHNLYWLNERLDRWDEVDAATDPDDGYLKADITNSGIYLMTYPAAPTTGPTVPTESPTQMPTDEPTTAAPTPTPAPPGWLAPLGAVAVGAALLRRKG
ncbi:hypothetical protein AZH53_01080 [Methanomicrobiaceae archaeon CYW5]|uniref:DUF3821 domain-containing protein n=1 Tax=Methanovulcanius yangii TaxID=1789227 RepID=UPI0029CA9AC1|nr:DUF3821 domain-containing protein [Methanovulcanius yangii]MBT8507022.1 hypothetical protein [Methanovulcanius yangii]